MAYEQALRANPNSIQAMNAISLILRTREEFAKAVEYLQAILKLDQHNGEVWGSVGELPSPLPPDPLTPESTAPLTPRAGHCYLMMDDLQQAYTAYQNALVNLRNPKVCRPRRRVGPSLTRPRSQSSGMASASCTTATGPWSTPKRPSRRS